MKQFISLLILLLSFIPLQGGNSQANDLVVDFNGSILTVGVANSLSNTTATQTLNATDFALVRYLPSGALDTTFNPFGTIPGILQLSLSNQLQTLGGNLEPVSEGLNSVALSSDQKIVAAGFYTVGLNSNVAVIKLNENGSLDTSFNANGQLGITRGMSVIDVGQFILPNNVATGVTQDTATGVAIDSQDRIVVVGSTNNGTFTSVLVIRLTPTGELDQTFNPTGITPGIFTYTVVQNDITSNILARAVALTPDDSIIVGGTVNGTYSNNSIVSSNFFILKLTPLGSVDTTFNAGGSPAGLVQQNFQGFFNQAFALKLDKDGNILIGGSSQQFSGGSNAQTGGDLTLFALARYTPLGLLDTTFNPNELSRGQPGTALTSISQHSDTIYGLAIDKDDGSIVATGVSNDGLNKSFVTARYLSTGGLDTTFNPTGPLPGVTVTQILPVPEYNMTPTVINRGTAAVIGSDKQVYISGFSFDGFQTNFTVLNYLQNGILNSSVFNPSGILSQVPGVVVTLIGQSFTALGNGNPLYVTEDVSHVSPYILETLRHPFEVVEPAITSDIRRIIREKEVVLEGYASPNALITLFVNDFEVAQTSARANGSWAITVPPLIDGTYEVHVLARDPLLGIALSSLSSEIQVKTYVPKTPIINSPAMSHVLDASTTFIEGTAEPKSPVVVYLDQKAYGTARTADTGRWRLPLTSTDGSHTVVAQVVLQDGTKSAQSKPITFTVNQSGEKEPAITFPQHGFVVRSPDLVVKGEGAPKTKIKLYAQNKLIAEIPVDINGQWTYTFKDALGAYELYAASAIKGYQSKKVTGSVILSRVEKDDESLLQGQAAPHGTVRIYRGSEYLGMTKADKQGNWSFTPHGKHRPFDRQPVTIELYDAEGVKQTTIEKL